MLVASIASLKVAAIVKLAGAVGMPVAPGTGLRSVTSGRSLQVPPMSAWALLQVVHDVAPVHPRQPAEHASQVLLEVFATVPTGHDGRHCEPDRKVPAAHPVQLSEPAAEQLPQPGSQATQVVPLR
jgi:hypothetical protein